MQETFQFRNVFNVTNVTQLANSIYTNWNSFDKESFIGEIITPLEHLNYGERNSLIADTLHKYLPKHFKQAVALLLQSLEPPLPNEVELEGFEGFIILPQCLFVSRYGIDFFDTSMKALYEMTKRFSAESDIRPFLKKYPQQTLAQLKKWAYDPHCLVRRLVSEGTRPRLPLCCRLPKFQKEPDLVIELLEILKHDITPVVRRSVANNLNDISKDNPDIVTEVLKKWSIHQSKEIKWLTQHALRTLIKQGNEKALQLLGYSVPPKIQLDYFRLISKSIEIGEVLEFVFKIRSTKNKAQNLMIDYIIYYQKANGKLAPKVYKLTKQKINPLKSLNINGQRSFKPINTRKFYKGVHNIEIQINGISYGKEDFLLV